MEYTLIGHPVAKSLSPKIHNAAFVHFSLDHHYTLSDVVMDGLSTKIDDIRNGKLGGANVTIPHKCSVIDFVDELCPVAKRCGAVNTLYMKNGKLHGSSTDGKGALRALREQGIDLQHKKVAMLGTGGAAKSVLAAIVDENIAGLSIVGRSSDKIKTLVELFGGNGVLFGEENAIVYDADIIINATSVGMYPYADVSPISRESIHKDHVVFDLVYKPLETKLLRIARENGAVGVDGLGMLIYQAIYAFELWTSLTPPVEMIRKELNNAIQ
ncbi:shikimate dehydrogenase [Candidatus Uabimicrobium amorphum]|uniref:Shikimate dehydrogenase (NADP(+)) n=1 Tax=Uabimicrobium amorphum TaxID=2596890 RepID=A0A5S9F8C6_UABAM|nr:shikimate dehydrogenase [Candidatus Uabimicrobium amorphum]BBM88182.1 shikimate dehydrogenase (NADP(+)) [Candidatus Uabimicrobium amorphum]